MVDGELRNALQSKRAKVNIAKCIYIVVQFYVQVNAKPCAARAEGYGKSKTLGLGVSFRVACFDAFEIFGGEKKMGISIFFQLDFLRN